MSRILIAEDEALLAAELGEELARLWQQAELLAPVGDGHAALRLFEEARPQVLFLDVQMPGLNGLEVARLVAGRAHVVFVTAYDQYAVQAFDEGAADYVLKPIEPSRLARAVQRVKARLGSPPADLGALVEQPAPPSEPLRWISVPRGRELQLITVDEVCYFRADNKYVEVATAEGVALITTPLKELLQRLPADSFWQVHRSVIVNLSAIRSVRRELDGRLAIVLRQRPEVLPVGSQYAARFRQL
jgi:DNA-binding LytR/AlgR family response regulator